VVDGIWTLVNQDAIFEANIGSGKGYSIEEWLETCFSLIGKDWKQYIVQKEGFVSHYKQLVSDSTLMFSLGWKPKVSLKELAESMMK
jgi:GDPmannose 4,6-dehydratase